MVWYPVLVYLVMHIDTAFIDADALTLSEQFASSNMQRSHGTIEAGPTRGQGRSLGIIRTTNNVRTTNNLREGC